MTRVLVVGSGLIGASLGLALQADPTFEVWLDDEDPAALELAVSRGAGTAWDRGSAVDVYVAAVPPRAIAPALSRAQRLSLARTYTHVSSVQSQVQREVEGLKCDLSSIVGSHPLAGRETQGPAGASADLFLGRPWAVCPSSVSAAVAVADVHGLVSTCGGVPLEIAPEAHDSAVALLSHLPQIASTALASLLAPSEPARAGESAGHVGDASAHVSAEAGMVQLSGSGLADTTRLAASPSALWADILLANAAHVVPAVHRLVEVLGGLISALEATNGPEDVRAREAVVALFEQGNRGRAAIPVKRGVRDEGFMSVPVEVDDRPGRLAALLTAAGVAGVNVEDVHVSHAPGRPTGTIELLVARDQGARLGAALAAGGWRILH